MKNQLRTSFPSISQNESLARSVAAAFCTPLDPTIEELSDLRTAVSEAVTNAIIHGYGTPDGVVYMDLECAENEVAVTVRDNGRGIPDIEQARQPFYTSMPDMERSGMGFAVMEAFMDSVEVFSKVGSGTEIVMKKRFRKL